jgi:hypothetical protein
MFNARSNDEVAQIAKSHLNLWLKTHPTKTGLEPEAVEPFLRSLSTRTGYNEGSRGGMSVWSFVCNGDCGEEFVNCLKPFWQELLMADHHSPRTTGLPHISDNVVVLVQGPDDNTANSYEISMYISGAGDEPLEEPNIRKFVCPFSFHAL